MLHHWKNHIFKCFWGDRFPWNVERIAKHVYISIVEFLEHTSDFIVPERCIWRFHHNNKFHFCVRHIAITGRKKLRIQTIEMKQKLRKKKNEHAEYSCWGIKIIRLGLVVVPLTKTRHHLWFRVCDGLESNLGAFVHAYNFKQ